MNTNWYNIAKQAALDPDAWSYESKPARLREHLNVVPSPFSGRSIIQPQNHSELDQIYKGIHFTPSEETAAIYACGKATISDPPVIIAIDPRFMQKKTDVDATITITSIRDYIENKAQQFRNILAAAKTPADIVYAVLEELDKDIDFWESTEETHDAGDAVYESSVPLPPLAIKTLLKGIPARKALQEVKSMLAGKISDQLLIIATNQFRITQPISATEVEGIYQVPWVDFGAETIDDEVDEEWLEENGYHKDGDDIVTSEGKILLSHEDIHYGYWLQKTPLYQNQQSKFNKWFGQELVWHGTTLSRARQAFPEIFGGRPS